MDEQTIPEAELSFSSFGLEDISKSVQAHGNDDQENGKEDEGKDEKISNDDLSSFVSANVDDSTVDTETETDTPEGEEGKSEVDDLGYDNNTYAAAMELIKENGLLHIPEELEGEITDEVWKDLLQKNESARDQRSLDRIKSSAGDTKIAELVDFVLDGGGWYGFTDMQEVIQDEIDISSLDENVEEDQRYMIELYLTDGLDGSNPAHARRLNNITNEVNNVFERLEQDELAKEAKAYMIDKSNARKQSIKDAKQVHINEEKEAKRIQRESQDRWNHTFKETLSNKKWTDSKKSEIISQFDIVQLSDNTEMEMWKYKFDAIWKSPESTQVLMDFLVDFDPQTLQFKSKGLPVEKKVTKTITDLINKKRQGKSNSQHTSPKRTEDVSKQPIDPYNY